MEFFILFLSQCLFRDCEIAGKTFNEHLSEFEPKCNKLLASSQRPASIGFSAENATDHDMQGSARSVERGN